MPVTVLRVDATIIESATLKPGVAGHFKGGIGFHPLTVWCSNTGDPLAIMQRLGNAGSSAGADHVKVLTHALTQIPAAHRRDVLVTIDGAGYSYEAIDLLTRWNTAKAHGGRGRRVEYSIGWPLDTRTQAAVEELPETAWLPRLSAHASLETDAEVADLTGILRRGPGGDRLAGWPADLRVIARRVQRGVGEQAELGQDAVWRYGAFATNTPTGQAQWLDARHRTQAHVEDKIKEWKAMGAARLPTADPGRNSVWLQLAGLEGCVGTSIQALPATPIPTRHACQATKPLVNASPADFADALDRGPTPWRPTPSPEPGTDEGADLPRVSG